MQRTYRNSERGSDSIPLGVRNVLGPLARAGTKKLGGRFHREKKRGGRQEGRACRERTIAEEGSVTARSNPSSFPHKYSLGRRKKTKGYRPKEGKEKGPGW